MRTAQFLGVGLLVALVLSGTAWFWGTPQAWQLLKRGEVGRLAEPNEPVLPLSDVPAPKIRRESSSKQSVSLTGAVIQTRPPGLRDRLEATVDSVEAVFAALEARGDTSASDSPVVEARRRSSQRRSLEPCMKTSARCTALHTKGGYVIDLGRDTVRVLGADAEGLVHGLTQLAAQARQSGGRLPTGRILDHPDHRTRALHFVLRGVDAGAARRLVVMARRAQMNLLIVQVADGLRLPSLPSAAREDAWSLATWTSFVEYARQNGLTVVPEVKLLSKQEKLFRRGHRDLLYNRYTYDPRNPEVYERVFALLDELIRATRPPAVHIGHDELAGATLHKHVPRAEQLPEGESALPPSLFLKDVRTLHAHLQKRGVETWMWGDMLVGPSEFPTMSSPSLHAPPAYAALRDSVPDEVVICDWHYWGNQSAFPTAEAFLEAGHEVLGATWKTEKVTDRFSAYLAGRGPAARGMIATTWFHVQRGEWRTVQEIVRHSGARYWTAG